jgi:hypothetical protein
MVRAAAAWLLTGAILATTLSGRANACSFVYGLVKREVWPPDGATVPASVRPVVVYREGWARASSLGADLALHDVAGNAVPFTRRTFGHVVQISPKNPLAPGMTYQLSDRRKLLCGDAASCALTAQAQTFASFTTTAVIDDAPPVFAGLAAIDFGSHEHENLCETDHESFVATYRWSAGHDEPAGDDVHYNIYRRAPDSDSPYLVDTVADANGLRAIVNCQERRWAGSDGTYVVRAVDPSGNEEQNDRQVVSPHDLCGSDGWFGCRIAGAPARGSGPAAATALLSILALTARRRRGPPRARG